MQLFTAGMDQVSGFVRLVALESRLEYQSPDSTKTQQVQGPGTSGEREFQHPSDVPQVQPLMTELHSELDLLRIEDPTLGACCA